MKPHSNTNPALHPNYHLYIAPCRLDHLSELFPLISEHTYADLAAVPISHDWPPKTYLTRILGMPMAVSMAELPPTPVSFDIDNDTHLEKTEQKRRLRDWLNLSRWRDKKEEPTSCTDPSKRETPPQTPSRPGIGRRLSRKGWVGIPRSQTFKRQEEEQRKNLTPIKPSIKERRDPSKVRQRALSAVPPPPRPKYRDSSVPPDLQHAYPSIAGRVDQNAFQELAAAQVDQFPPPPPPPPPPQPPPQDPNPQRDADPPMSDYDDEEAMDEELMEELKKKWILNLSMHFRDKSPREKFFLTYAETLDRWRRVTVSCDYRDAPLDSLESDLQHLHYQKDKSARIYESIRMSLPDIQFYDTVTNLKLETKDDRLHVHVTEDVNEIIPYPPVHLVNHLPQIHKYSESELRFDEHMSGFVYRVNVGGNTWIKKEIPGPDSVDEFLYEVNALSRLVGSKSVIQLKGLVIDNLGKLIKGLLLAYAKKGALVDIIYDSREGHLPRVDWSRRERWARQIVQGLSNIHEAGFVQGDFTLSNIVIDDDDDAQIIDINRRGCPVGWESPEMVPLVESGQRLSMYIGVKSDLYQLGMVLWALAMEKDEPERAPRPLKLPETFPDTSDYIPQYYRDLTAICLSKDPNRRYAAKDLLAMFNDPPLFSKLRQQELPGRASKSNGANATLIRHGSAFAEVDGISEQNPQSQERRIGGANGTNHACPPGRYPINEPQSEDKDADEEGFRGRRPPMRSGTMGIPQDGSPALSISRHGTHTYPAAPGQFLFNTNRAENLCPGRSEGIDAQIVPISPTSDGDRQQITMGGNPYLVHRDTLEDLDEEEYEPRRAHVADGWRHGLGRFDHVDSGLADMDPDDLIPRQRHNTELAGIGEHVNLNSQHQVGADAPPQRIIEDLEIEHKAEDSSLATADRLDVEPKAEEGIFRGKIADPTIEPEREDIPPQGKIEPEGIQHSKEPEEKAS